MLKKYVGLAFIVPGAVLFGLIASYGVGALSSSYLLSFFFLFVPLLNFGINVAQTSLSTNTSSLLLPRNRLIVESLSQYPTAIVIPAMIKEASHVALALASLRENYIASVSSDVPLLLLVDYCDWHEPAHPDDAKLTALLSAGVSALNESVGEQSPRFGLLVRARKFNEAAGSWMGWERKRGKLVELFRYIETGIHDSLSFYHCGDLRSLRFVITLDLDARLGSGAVESLINTAAHPRNRPILENGKVVRGYTIFAPSIDVVSTHPSFFFKANEAQYPSPVMVRGIVTTTPFPQPSFFQDVFGSAIYHGKALIDVASFNAAVSPCIKENSILSHDHLEGWLSRVALVSDARLRESSPATWYRWQLRRTRWTKGDLLLLPWILKGWDGPRNCDRSLSMLARWVLMQDLIYLATPFFIFLFFLAAIALPNIDGWVAAIVGIVLINPQGPMFSPFCWSLFGRRNNAVQIVGFEDAKRALIVWSRRVLVELLFLYGNAVACLRALIQAASALMGNKKHALDWDYANPERQCLWEIAELIGIWCSVFGIEMLFTTNRWLALVLAGLWLCFPFASCVRTVSVRFE